MTIARPQKHLSLIETISTGYAVLNRRLWVLLIPVALDLYFLLGRQVSFAPLFRLLRDSILEAAVQTDTDPQQVEQFFVQLQQTDMRSILAVFNFVPVLVPQLLNTGTLQSMQVLHISSLPGMVLTILVINFLALLISSLFLTVIAAGVREAQAPWWEHGRWLLSAIAGIGGYVLVLVGMIGVLSLPFLLLASLVALLLPQLAALMLIGWFILWFWVYIYTGFAVEAVVLNNVSLLRAFRQSIQIVRAHFLGTTGLVALSIVIVAGLNVVWSMLSTNLFGLLLAIAGSAYIGSGLVAARLIFYRDRLAHVMQGQKQTEV